MRVAFLVCLIFSFACGSSQGTYSREVYRDTESAFHLAEPSGGSWRQVDVDDQNDLAWTSGSAVIQVNSSCSPNLDIPLEALTNHLLIGFTERSVVEQKRIPMASREALRTHVQAKLDGVAREMVLVVLKKDQCVYDFAVVAEPGPDFERAQPVLDRMLASFETR